MKKLKKIIKYSLSILALVVLALLIVPFFLNVDDYKVEIEQKVEDATGRALKIGGLQASLFPWVGVTLDDVTFANRAGFTQKDFLKVKHLDVQVALLPLLSKQLEIKRFELDAPEVFLEKNAHGENNWEDLMPTSSASVTAIAAEPTEKAEPKSSVGALAALSAEQLVLKNGKFIWKDAQSSTEIGLTDVQVTLDDVQLERPVKAHISARLNDDKFELNAVLGPLGDLTALDVNHLPVQLDMKTDGIRLKGFAAMIPAFPEILGKAEQASVSMDMTVEQRPDGVRLVAGKLALLAAKRLLLDMKAEMPSDAHVRVHKLALSMDDKALLQLQGEITSLNKTPRYELRVQTEKLARTWLAGFVPELESMYAAHPAAWKDMKLGASLAGTSSRVDVRDMQLMLDEELVQISGSADFAGAPDIRMRVAAKTLHLDPWLPKPAEAKESPVANSPATVGQSSTVAQKAIEPDLRFLKDWRVSLQLQFERMLMHGLDMGQVRGTLKGERGVFKLNPFRFDLAEGQVTETASLNVNSYPASWTESIHISGLKLGPVLKAVADTDVLDGTMQLNTDLSAKGLLPETSMQSLNGTAQLSLLNGKVKGFDIAGAMRNISSLGQASSVSQSTDFAQLQASFKIRNGIAKNEDLFMASPLFRLTGQGVADLPASNIDFHVRPKLIGSLTGQGDTVTARKGISVPLHISGPFNAPKVRPEMDAESLIDNVGALGGKGGKIGGVLGSILSGGKTTAPANQPTQTQPSSNPAQSAPVQQPNQQQQMQKAIQGLLGF